MTWISLAGVCLACLGSPRASAAEEMETSAEASSAERTPDTSSRDSAQEPSHVEASPRSTSRDGFDRRHRRQLYREGRLRYGRAALLTMAFPGLGNIYANQYLIGGVAFSLMGFAALLVSYGWATEQPVFMWAAAGTAGGAYMGGLASSLLGVRAYNIRLRSRLSLSRAELGHPMDPPDVRALSLTVVRF